MVRPLVENNADLPSEVWAPSRTETVTPLASAQLPQISAEK